MWAESFSSNSNALVGGWAVRAISEIKADVSQYWVRAVFWVVHGPSALKTLPEDEIKKAMIKSANRVIVLGDCNKGKHLSSMIKFL